MFNSGSISKPLIVMAGLILFFSNHLAKAQTVPVQYLEPKFVSDPRYNFMRLGTSSTYFGGIMHNISDNGFGDGDDFTLFTYSSRDMVLSAAAGNVILNHSGSGKIGLGTVNPIEKIHLKGNIYIEGTAPSVNGWSYSNVFYKGHSLVFGTQPGRYAHSRIEIKPGGSSSGKLVSALQLYDATAENVHELKVKVASTGESYFNGGNVGIGTAAPSSTLEIAGDIKTSKEANFGGNRLNLLSYSLNNTPAHGVKILTNLSFTSGSQMPTLTITGFNYGDAEPISLNLVWYAYQGTFRNTTISSSGAYTPRVMIGEENGKVVLFIDSKEYFQRFTVSAFENGRPADNNTWYKGWTAVDEPLNANAVKEFTYENNFAGKVHIRKLANQDASLTVSGNILASEVRVSTDANSVPDYVFKPDYQLMPLEEVAAYVEANSHLPEVPSAEEVAANGHNLAEMNLILLKKIEELTLHTIRQEKLIQQLIQNQAQQK